MRLFLAALRSAAVYTMDCVCSLRHSTDHNNKSADEPKRLGFNITRHVSIYNIKLQTSLHLLQLSVRNKHVHSQKKHFIQRSEQMSHTWPTLKQHYSKVTILTLFQNWVYFHSWGEAPDQEHAKAATLFLKTTQTQWKRVICMGLSLNEEHALIRETDILWFLNQDD